VAISLHAGLAALGGGALVWGPLGGGWPAVLLAGAALGLLGWALSRRRSLARFGLHGAIALGFVAAALIPLYRLNILLPETSDRQANFERLWRAMDAYYPYFALKGVDWDATYRRYQPLVAATSDDPAYWRLMAAMLAELKDGHTNLQSPARQSGRFYFGTARPFGAAIMVDAAGQIGQAAGLERCAVLLAVDGKPIAAALADMPAILTAGGTPDKQRALAAANLLSTTGASLDVTFSDTAGRTRTVTLQRPTDAPPPSRRPTPAPALTAERLPSGFGLIRLPSFVDDEGALVAAFDAALDDLRTDHRLARQRRRRPDAGRTDRRTFYKRAVRVRTGSLRRAATATRLAAGVHLPPNAAWNAVHATTGAADRHRQLQFGGAIHCGAGRCRPGDDGWPQHRRRKRQPDALQPDRRRLCALLDRRFSPHRRHADRRARHRTGHSG
jgi:hypothetical protein